ncbi:hypothetical protein HNY73_017790 [Argiope bruennichi]|uniref:Uncharacterized protein n=1 Tax=Argiope bruennichi TaxID=94029 RepID=A0A8T0EC77_ARGBR|nr:hypothetical protein HNY73_017790 [Argiope bruennichi]
MCVFLALCSGRGTNNPITDNVRPRISLTHVTAQDLVANLVAGPDMMDWSCCSDDEAMDWEPVDCVEDMEWGKSLSSSGCPPLPPNRRKNYL